MKDIFEKIDTYFSTGVGLNDVNDVAALNKLFEQKLQQLSPEELEELDAQEEEYKGKFEAIFKSIQELEEKKKEEAAAKAQEKEALEAQKAAIIEEITHLIQEEKSIGKAFEVFHELREKWNTIATGKHSALDKKYAKLVEDFYYHINMYKAIKDHDFKRNQQLKSALITRLNGMLQLEHSKNMIPQLKQIQKEWQGIGPVGKELRDDIWDKYIEACDAVFQRFLSLKEAEQKVIDAEVVKQKELIQLTDHLNNKT